MKSTRFHLVIIGFALAYAISTQAQEASVRVRNEIERLRTIAAAQPADNDLWKQIKPGAERFLTMADTALRAGNLLYAVEALGKANEYLVGYESAMRAQRDKADRTAFDVQWKQISLLLERNGKHRNWSSVPAALRALSESGQGQGGPLLEGGRAFASLNDIVGGYFYIGQAASNEQSSRFAASVPLIRKGAALPFRSVLPEINKLQERTNAAFVPPRSIEKHPEFIRLNAALKTAGELDAGKYYAGALYQYLQAVSYFEALDMPSLGKAKQEQIRESIKTARQRIAKSNRDDSLVELFIQRAETFITTKNGDEPTVEEWKNAAAVVDHVMAAYYNYLTPHPVPSTYKKPIVTVTLVRWPYT